MMENQKIKTLIQFKSIFIKLFFFYSFFLINSAYSHEYWCIQDLRNPPCNGKRGRCTRNSDGSKGGFVAYSAHVEKTWNSFYRKNKPYIGQFAQICDRARVHDYSRVEDYGSVSENAQIFEQSKVYDQGEVSGNARLYGKSQVYGQARVYENAVLYENSKVYGNARVSGKAELHEEAQVFHEAWVQGTAQLRNDSRAFLSAVVSQGTYHTGDLPKDSYPLALSLIKKSESHLDNTMISRQFSMDYENHPELENWVYQAHQRAASTEKDPPSIRQKLLQSSLALKSEWTACEGIMTPSVTVKFILSMDRLEKRYPFAAPTAAIAFDQMVKTILQFNVTAKPNGNHIKEAAVRFLQSNLMNDTTEPQLSGLSPEQTLAVVWAAINDKSIFPDQSSFVDRIWGLIESLGCIQRTHNSQNEQGYIQWDWVQEQDRPSCVQGMYKRFLEDLHGHHPDVTLYCDLPATNANIAEAISMMHSYLFPSLDESIKIALIEEDESALVSYTSYLKERVQKAISTTTQEQLDQIITVDAVRYLNFNF